MVRARSTRPRMSVDGSADSLLERCLYSTAGTSTWMSMRSSSGPAMRLRTSWFYTGSQAEARKSLLVVGSGESELLLADGNGESGPEVGNIRRWWGGWGG